MKFGGPRMVELVLRDSNMQDISCIKKGEGGMTGGVSVPRCYYYMNIIPFIVQGNNVCAL